MKKLSKDHKLFLIGCITGVIILSLVMIPTIINMTYNNPIYYIATDDIYFDENGIIYNEPYLHSSGCDNDLYDKYLNTYIRFNLSDKPIEWNKCEVSFYVYDYFKPDASVVYNFVVNLFEGNWNETSDNTEIYWRLAQQPKWRCEIAYRIGFHKIDMTNYIKNNNTISIEIEGYFHGFYGDLYVYSKDANVNPEYKPQLIWS